MVQVLSGVPLPVIHQLGAGLIQLQLERLNRFQVTHRVEHVRDVIVADHHKRLTIRIRHRYRINKETITVLREHRHRVLRNVVELPDSDTILVEDTVTLVLVLRSVLGVYSSVSIQILTNRRLVPLILLSVLQRPHNLLSDPPGIIHAGCFRINEDVKWGNPFNKRLILNDHHGRFRQISVDLLIGRQ